VAVSELLSRPVQALSPLSFTAYAQMA